MGVFRLDSPFRLGYPTNPAGGPKDFLNALSHVIVGRPRGVSCRTYLPEGIGAPPYIRGSGSDRFSKQELVRIKNLDSNFPRPY